MEDSRLDSKISWFAAVACGCMNFLIMIPTKVSGLFFVEILDRYRVSRHLGGYPTFTVTLMRCSGGPLAGYFAERFGLKRVLIVGSILSAAGISICFFAQNISFLTISLGVIHGSGVAINNTLMALLVKVHFKKHITLAFGVTQAGSCIGAFFTSPLLLWIFQNYGTSGGFLIIGAMVLNSLPIVMIINILSPDVFSSKSGNSMKSKKCTKGQLETGVTKMVSSSGGEDSDMADTTGDENEKNSNARKQGAFYEIRNRSEREDSASLVLNRRKCDQAEVATDLTDGKSPDTSSEFNVCRVSTKGTGSETRKEVMELVLDECDITSEIKIKSVAHQKENNVDIDRNINDFRNDVKRESIPLMNIRTKTITNLCDDNPHPLTDHTYPKSKCKIKSEINNENTLGNVKANDPSKGINSDTLPNTSVKNISASSSSDYSTKTQQQLMTPTEEGTPQFLSTFNPASSELTAPINHDTNRKEILKTDKQIPQRANVSQLLKIFLDVTFWVVIISQSLHVFVLIVFWTTMIDFSRDKNIDRSMEVYLLMVLPIAEIIGRLGLAWITDRNYLTRTRFSVLSFIIMGFSCSLMALARGFYVVIISIFVFGAITSGLITMLPMIVFEFFDSTEHTMGQASRYCLFGPLSFLNGPLIGYFRDTVGSYAWLYHTMAVVSVACGALSATIPVLARRRDEKRKKERTG